MILQLKVVIIGREGSGRVISKDASVCESGSLTEKLVLQKAVRCAKIPFLAVDKKKNEKAKPGVKISLAYLEKMDNKDPVTKVEPKGHI